MLNSKQEVMHRTHATILTCVQLALAGLSLAADEGRLVVNAVDKASGQPIAARMHLKNQRGQPVKPTKAPFWKDHFVFDGTITLDLPLGTYFFEMEHGPEYKLIE